MADDDIVLKVNNHEYKLKKQLLCDHSDYFRAMFSGNFKEHDQQEITVDIVDATSMKMIIQYLATSNSYDLSQYSLATIGNLAEAVQILQITKLADLIESFLIPQEITTKNWFEIRRIAEHNISYRKLRQSYADFGVPPLKVMEPQYVPSIQELVWYLSQTHLYVKNECEVFKFALDWMSYSNTAVDPPALLMFLGCLDMKRVTTKDLVEIRSLCHSVFGFNKSCPAKVIDCLIDLSKDNVISGTEIVGRENVINEKYTKNVFDRVLKMVECSRSRDIKRTPVVSMYEFSKNKATSNVLEDSASTKPPTVDPIFNFTDDDGASFCEYNLYAFTNAGLEKWLELNIPKPNNSYYFTWSFAVWGLSSLIFVISKCKQDFQGNTDSPIESGSTIIYVYNVLKKQWTRLEANLPEAMIRKSAIVGDSLYIICGKGDNNIVYDLMKKTYRTIAKLPFEIVERIIFLTNMPLVCVHKDEVYVSYENIVYKYEEKTDRWIQVIEWYYKRLSTMVSLGGYIYVTTAPQHNARRPQTYRFRSGEDTEMKAVQNIDHGDNMIVYCNTCSLEDRLMYFTARYDRLPDFNQRTTLSVQEYSPNSDVQFKEVWSQQNDDVEFDSKRNACALFITSPPPDADVTEYLKECLNEITHSFNNGTEVPEK